MEYPSAQESPRKSISIKEVNDLVERGYVYVIQNSIQGIAQNSVVDLSLNLSEIDSVKNLYLVESIFSISSGEALAQFYLPGNYDDSEAVDLPSVNRNEYSSHVSQAKVTYKTDGVTVPGAKLPTSYQLSAEKHSGGSGASGDNYLTKVNKNISRLLRFTHSGTDAFNLEIRFIYVEM